MNGKEVKSFLPILQAFADGKEIECREEDKWYKVLEICNETNPQDYRIKPEPKYRPFNDAEECWQELLKHQPFGWVKDKDKGFRLNIVGLNQKRAFTQVGHNYDQALDEFTFADGTPFGILEEE